MSTPVVYDRLMHEPSRETDNGLMTSREVAAMLRVPVSSVYAWRVKGTGPSAFRVGKQTLYRRSDVEAWLEERRTDGQRLVRTA